jgi:2-polyprenyl-3-methyl-5-hydroxy-6-metoxy-1,4-benzoquinol methylase
VRRRLRQEVSADYQVVRDNTLWPDHVLRSLLTAGAVAWLKPETVCDPACGDASIVTLANRIHPIRRAYLNDISVPQITALREANLGYKVTFSAGDAGVALRRMGPADVIVLTEILEHIEDPDQLLRMARIRGRFLVASSPLNEQDNNNHEHIWGWDKAGYGDMLRAAGWEPIAYTEVFPRPFYYTFQLWVCQ